MTLTAEQILASHKANIETLFGLTTKAFEGVEKLVELNVTASRAALTEAASHTQAVLGVKDAQELLALQASLFQPLAEKTAAYSRHLFDIAWAPALNSARLSKPRPLTHKGLHQLGGQRCKERPCRLGKPLSP